MICTKKKHENCQQTAHEEYRLYKKKERQVIPTFRLLRFYHRISSTYLSTPLVPFESMHKIIYTYKKLNDMYHDMH